MEARPPSKFEPALRDPWGRVTIGQPARFPSWVPDEVRSSILRGLPDGLTEFRYDSEPKIVVWVRRSGGLSDHQLYRYFPEDLAFYQTRTNDPDVARLLHNSMVQWNRMMRHLVEQRGLSPNEAHAEIRRADAAVFRAVLGAVGVLFAGGGGLGSLGKRAVATSTRPRLIRSRGPSANPAARSTLNPFKGKTPKQVDEIFRSKGFEPRGPAPLAGKGGYVNPKTGRSYHLDPGGTYKRGIEHPHVDVNRRKGSMLPKRKFPLGDKLSSKE